MIISNANCIIETLKFDQIFQKLSPFPLFFGRFNRCDRFHTHFSDHCVKIHTESEYLEFFVPFFDLITKYNFDVKKRGQQLCLRF
jgi:hypothetical protein